MIINASAVAMAAKTTKNVSYTQKEASVMNNMFTGERQFGGQSFLATYQKKAEEKRRAEQGASNANIPEYRNVGNTGMYLPSPEDLNSRLEMEIRSFIDNVRRRLTNLISRGFFGSLWGNNNGILNLSSGGNYSLWNRTTYFEYTYEETESLEFTTKGIVKTADGRDIEFDMSLEMSREFVSKTEGIMRDTVAIMTDPLVINLDSSPIGVSDKKWKFDIDGDGSEDNISMLSNGAAFLAYDKNGDGKINDGTEFFGARTGNGFAELAEYDEDGNGWIDENDSIYKKLSVWQKDDAGHDKLMGLKEANVGAIYLGNVASEYSLKSDLDNSHNAQIRKSGMYLSENGMARSIQQLDMVKALVS